MEKLRLEKEYLEKQLKKEKALKKEDKAGGNPVTKNYQKIIDDLEDENNSL